MLDAMRKQASSWLVRLLLMLLILSFAVWGIGDLFLGAGRGNAVAEVGGLEVTRLDLDRQLDTDIRQLQATFNNSIDRQQALAFGVLNQSLQTLVARRLVDRHAKELGLGVADETIGREIRENMGFGTGAGFDRARFDLFLRSRGKTEDEFIEDVRQDMSRNLLLSAVTESVTSPEELANRLQLFRGEQRTAEVLTVLDQTQQVDDPSEEELATYLVENSSGFRAPEYRSVVLASLEPEDIASEIAIAEEDVRAEYNARLGEYTTDERRELAQLLSNDQTVIAEAARLANEGVSFADILAELNDTDLSFSTIGPVVKNDLPIELGDAAWAIELNDIGAPVESPFGWHLIKIAAIEPEVVQSFDEMAPEIRDRLAAEQAIQELPTLANALDDEIAAGTELEQAARSLGIRIDTISAVDARGRDQAGDRLDTNRLTQPALAQIFLAEPQQISLLEETDTGGYYMFRVRSVVADRPRDLSEVRDELGEIVRGQKQRASARARAEALLQRANGGATLLGLAEELAAQADLRKVGPITRSVNPQLEGLSASAMQQIFATDINRLAPVVVDLPVGVALIRTTEITQPETDAALADLTNELASQIRTDLLTQYEAELRRRYVVQVNEAALADMMTSFQGDDPHRGHLHHQ